MVNEASRILEEKIAFDPADIDTGMIFGTGFPPFRGGLLRWADFVGARTIVERLSGFSESLGARFAPAPGLKELAVNGRKYL